MSLTREEKLELLIEECAEVIIAVTKIQRFGWDTEEPGYGVNCTELAKEMGDLAAMIDAVSPHLSFGDVEEFCRQKNSKIARAETCKERKAQESRGDR